MKKKILGGIGVIVLAAVCICGFFLSGAGSKYYYTQIDNSFLELMEPDGGVSFTLPPCAVASVRLW